MLQFHMPIHGIHSYHCKDSKPCERIDSQILASFNEKLSSTEQITGIDASKHFFGGDKNALKRKESEDAPDLESCFDSDFLFDLARIEDTEVNSNDMNNTDSCLHGNNSYYAHDPPHKKQKRRDSLTIFQSMVDDGDLDFNNDDEQITFSDSELSLPKGTATKREASKFCKDPAEDIRKNLSNRVKQLMSSSIGNDFQSNGDKEKKLHVSKSLCAPPSIVGDCDSAMKPWFSFQDGLQKSQKSQQLLSQWDDMMGLKQCHARTMIKSARSRKKLLKVVTKTIKKAS